MRLDRQVQEWFTRTPGLVEAMFDGLPDVMFYVKDIESRYLWANQTLIDRAGLKVRTNIVGLTADQLFPVAGSSTVAPDLEVIRTGCPIRDFLRLYRTYRGDRFWCLSTKFPLLDAFGHIVGLAGLSRDLPRPNERHRSYNRRRDSWPSSTVAWMGPSGSPWRPSTHRFRKTRWGVSCSRCSPSRPSNF